MRSTESIRSIALGAGIAAVLAKVDIGLLVAPLLGLRNAGLITILSAIGFASAFVIRKDLGVRCHARPWAWISFGALGCLLLAVKYFANSPTLFLWPIVRRLESPDVHTLLWLALLPLMLIVSAGIRAPSNLCMPFSPRIWIALALFFGMTFDFVTPFMLRSISLPELFDAHQAPKMSVWPLYLEWLIPAALAFWAAKWLNVYVRKPRGLGIATAGLIYFAVIEIWVFVQLANMGVPKWPGTSGLAALLLMLFVVSVGPHLVLAHALIVVGTIWMLFSTEESLDSRADRVEDHASAGNSPAAPRPNEGTIALSPRVESQTPLALYDAGSQELPLGDDPVSKARRLVAEKPSDLTRHLGLHRALLTAGQSAGLFEHARDYLHRLIRESRSEQAYEVLSTCLKLDSEFKPTVDDVLPLARLAMMNKDPRSALLIMRKFDSNHPGHPHTADIFYLSARGAREIGKVEVARTLLKTLLERFATAPVAHDARTLLAALERNASPP